MTDLSKAISNLPAIDLFSNNLSDNTLDGEILTKTVENSQMQNPLSNNDPKDVDEFLFLLTHIGTPISNHQEAKQNSIPVSEVIASLSSITGASVIDSEKVLENPISEETNEEQSAHVMEDNVAVSWINSPYYQNVIEMTKLNMDLQDDKAIENRTPIMLETEEDVPTFGENSDAQIQNSLTQQVVEDWVIQNESFLSEVKQEADANWTSNDQKTDSVEDKNISIGANGELNVTIKTQETLNPVQKFQNVNENIITQEEQQTNAPALIEITEVYGLLPNSHSYPMITPDSSNLIESTVSNITSRNILASREEHTKSMSSLIPLGPNANSLEVENLENQIIFQPLNQIEIQNEIMLPTDSKLTHLIEHVNEINLASMVNVLATVEINTPTRTLDISQTLTIPMEINNPEWSDQFSQHIIWLGQQEVKGAIIKINPEHLGPLEISLKIINDTASINITTHNSHVRDIIDQSLPKLQVMMADQGLNLSEVHIDSETHSRQFSQQNTRDPEKFPQGDVDEVTPLKNKRVIKGLVDYFA
ncbi:flagellar hook-length control protein FliK [Legionella sp. WA2024007413]